MYAACGAVFGGVMGIFGQRIIGDRRILPNVKESVTSFGSEFQRAWTTAETSAAAYIVTGHGHGLHCLHYGDGVYAHDPETGTRGPRIFSESNAKDFAIGDDG